jgi:hypothetical protein
LNDSLQKLLYKKYLDKNLAALYMARYDSAMIDPNLWVDEFLAQFSSVADHPDVLKINKTEKETEYKVESASIKQFLNFLNYRPIQLNKKFIFLFDAPDLSVILSSKLLKTFEELGADFCLIMMVPDNAVLLATVESRAIKLQIPTPKNAQVLPNSANFEDFNSPAQLLAHLKQSSNANADEKKFIELAIFDVLSHATATPEYYNKLEAVLRNLENFEVAASYNNSKQSRLAAFFP